MGRSIRLNLSKQSVRRAIRKTKATEEDMRRMADIVSKELAFEAVFVARTKVAERSKYISSDTISGIMAVQNEFGTWSVVSTAPESKFIEYGTGPKGANSPHPKAKDGFYKETGWVTQADGKDMAGMYGWKPRIARDGNTVYYTEGQEPKRFLYDARKHIMKKEVVDRIVQKAIKEVLG